MSIPGIRDLMIDNPHVDDPEKCELAVSNCLLPITCGIEAIGQLMGSYDDNAGLPDGTFQDIGHLLAFLSRLSNHLQFIQGNTDLAMRERTGKQATA